MPGATFRASGRVFHTQTTQRFFRASMNFITVSRTSSFPAAPQRMRARLSITHRLFSEMFNIRQISRLSTPSPPQCKTVEMLFGILLEQS